MTATDEPRAMSGYPHTLRPELHKALEDAGIDYWVAQGLTFWNCEDGRECVAYGYQTNDGPKLAVKVVGFTSPEQAIAATLGERQHEEIVLCKDCEHFTANDELWLEPPQVPFPMIGATSDSCDFWAGTKCKVEPNGFCAWGERRAE